MAPIDKAPEYVIEDVTVNINTVNRPEFLHACLESLIKTTPPGLPLQIVFNGSPGETVERTIQQASSWQGPTNFVVLEETLPIAESHNRALEGIQTSLVNFMGDDDVVLGNRLPKLVDAFNTTDPTPVAVSSYAHRIAGDSHDPVLGSVKKLGATTVEDWRTFHHSGEPFELLWPGAVLDVAALRSIGGFETDFALSFDCRVFSQMSFEGPVITIEDRQFGFRIHQGSISSSNWEAQRENRRFVGACHRARLEGRNAPTFDEFRNAHAEQHFLRRLQVRQSDKCQFLFRSGGETWLRGDRLAGAQMLARSALAWPPAFVKKVRDQGRGANPGI